MALVILGKTICPLCGKTLDKDDDIVTFPAGLFGRQEPAHVVDDAGVHRACLLSEHFGAEALERRQTYINQVEGSGE